MSFFTGLIRDKQGRKMSKSLGNSPDPLDLIAKYGADGLRFGLMRIAPSGQDIAFDEKQIEEGRNFATKLWNAARFRQMHGRAKREGGNQSGASTIDRQMFCSGSMSCWSRKFPRRLPRIQFDEVAQTLYRFLLE